MIAGTVLSLLLPLVASHSIRSVSQSFEDDCLRAHNAARSLHSHTGGLEWDQTLAQQSQQWIQQNMYGGNVPHSCSWGSPCNYGENIWWYWFSNASPDNPPSCAEAVFDWYNERVKPTAYNFATPYWNNGYVLHFTQVVWKETKRVGCGIDYYNKYWFILCQYSPRGNMRISGPNVDTDQLAISNVGQPKPGSQVPSGPEDLMTGSIEIPDVGGDEPQCK